MPVCRWLLSAGSEGHVSPLGPRSGSGVKKKDPRVGRVVQVGKGFQRERHCGKEQCGWEKIEQKTPTKRKR